MLVDVKNTDFECKEPPQFPFKYRTGQGAFIDGAPMLCGGNGGTPYLLKHCFMLQNREWIPTGIEMEAARYGLGRGNVVIDNKLLVSGGNNETGRQVGNELISTTGKIDLPDFPMKLWLHCNVLLNKTHLMTTGGTGGSSCDNKKTMILNLETKKWTDGPDMVDKRCQHGCAKVKVGDDGQEYVLAYGSENSVNSNNNLFSTEYLNVLDIGSGWKKGPDLPIQVSRMAFTTSLDMKEHYTFGGVNGEKDIMKWSCTGSTIDSCNWQVLDMKLAYGHGWNQAPMAIQIPDDTLANQMCNN